MSDLRNLLKRIRQWDALDIPNSDGAYWKREIDTALAQQAEQQSCPDDAACRDETVRRLHAEVERLRAENASLTQLLKDIPPFEAECEAERSSRGMFVARLEKMQETGDQWLTIAAVLALLYDCDRLTGCEVKASPAPSRPR